MLRVTSLFVPSRQLAGDGRRSVVWHTILCDVNAMRATKQMTIGLRNDAWDWLTFEGVIFSLGWVSPAFIYLSSWRVGTLQRKLGIEKVFWRPFLEEWLCWSFEKNLSKILSNSRIQESRGGEADRYKAHHYSVWMADSIPWVKETTRHVTAVFAVIANAGNDENLKIIVKHVLKNLLFIPDSASQTTPTKQSFPWTFVI